MSTPVQQQHLLTHLSTVGAAVLNRSGAQVKNFSARRDRKILRRKAPQNDTHLYVDNVLVQLVQPRYDLFGKQFHRALAFGWVEAGQMHPEDEMGGAYIFRKLRDLTSDFLRSADHRTGQ